MDKAKKPAETATVADLCEAAAKLESEACHATATAEAERRDCEALAHRSHERLKDAERLRAWAGRLRATAYKMREGGC